MEGRAASSSSDNVLEPCFILRGSHASHSPRGTEDEGSSEATWQGWGVKLGDGAVPREAWDSRWALGHCPLGGGTLALTVGQS